MQALFSSACVEVTLDPATRRLTLRALDAPIDDTSVSTMFSETEALLETGEPFSTLWDVRWCRFPPAAVTWRCIRWAVSNKRNLDRLNTQLDVVCSPSLLSTVKLVLRVFGPTCPTNVSTE